MDDFSRPLNDDEFVELGELLASIPEPYQPMEPDQMDGFLVALLAMPDEIPPTTWMPYIFDEEAQKGAGLADVEAQNRLETLIYRRYRSLDKMLAAGKSLDPIVYPIENERGHEVKGFDSIGAIVPFSIGFYEAFDRWAGLKELEDELVSSALLGIFRHLPDELIGDLEEVRDNLMLESPIENLDQAIEDLALSVAEIMSVTRGFKPAEEKNHRAVKKPATPSGFYREERRPSQGRDPHSFKGPRQNRENRIGDDKPRRYKEDERQASPFGKSNEGSRKPAKRGAYNPFGKPSTSFSKPKRSQGRRDH